MNSRKYAALLLVPFIIVALDGCRWRKKKKEAPKDYNHALAPGELGLREVDPSELPNVALTPGNREALKKAIGYSLEYFSKPSSTKGYPVGGIAREQVIQSLKTLTDLLNSTTSDEEFNASLHSRFRVFMSVGCDDEGTVLFTGYCTPIYEASLTPNEKFRYPIYKKPADLIPGQGDAMAQQQLPDGSTRPYPSRAEIEASRALKGTELAYLADPFEVYVLHVQGSGKLHLASGEYLEIGFDGTNNHQYYPIAKDMIAEGKIAADQLSLATMRAYFREHPEQIGKYTSRNPRFVFFAPSKRGIVGSLNVPVTSDVTIATDKSIFPRGAPTLVKTALVGAGDVTKNYAAIRVDQDTGGAIRAPGRCDLYMGVGDIAESRAGSQMAEGRLYYLIAK